MVAGFLVGTVFAMLATIAEAAFRRIVPYTEPNHAAMLEPGAHL